MGPVCHDAAKLQGWTALILDTNGNGKLDVWVEAEQRVLTAPSTTPNWGQQEAMADIFTREGPGAGAASLLWLKAFGIQAVIVCGPKSTEFWKPYVDPQKFDGILPAAELERCDAALDDPSAPTADILWEGFRWVRIRIRTTAHKGQVVSIQTAITRDGMRGLRVAALTILGVFGYYLQCFTTQRATHFRESAF